MPSGLDADIVIIGSGVAGLLLASRLRERGRRIVVLESGGRETTDRTDALNEVKNVGRVYCGASRGRARRLGGTSTLWGGAMLPFFCEDMVARPLLGIEGWPVSIDSVTPYLKDIHDLFGLDRGSLEEDFVGKRVGRADIPVGDPDFVARFAKWPRFRDRNFAALFRSRIERDPELVVMLNATATNFHLDVDSGRVAAVTASAIAGPRIAVRGRDIVICAGAIETTRLLLRLHRHEPRIAPVGEAVLGRYLFDHILAQLAHVEPAEPSRPNRLAGHRFVGRTMRSFRLELTPGAQARARLPSAWAHVATATDAETGVDSLRDLLRGRQRTGRIDPAAVMRACRYLPYFVRLAAWRVIRGQLLWPSSSRYDLHLVTAFPTGAGANPTLMLMLFTLRLADKLASSWSSQNAATAKA